MEKLIFLFFVLILNPIRAQENPISNWQQDGPLTPNFNGQTFRGWVDAICVNEDNTQEMLIATRTSGLFRTENGGDHWYCVTDSMKTPVIGCRTMIVLPKSKRVVAITGYEKIKGTVIYSDDFGQTWKETEQDLPTFRWVDYHPSIPDLLFACSKKDVYYSIDGGEKWKIIGSPSDVNYRANEMFKLLVKKNSISLISKARWDAEAFLHEMSFLISKRKSKVRFSIWSKNLADEYKNAPSDKIFFMDFSNKAKDIHYFQYESKQAKRTYRTTNGGETYVQLDYLHFPVGHWWKNELIASLNNPNIVYWGQVGLMKQYNLKTKKSTLIHKDSLNPGHHDDYRSSHIISIKGKDFIALGHDGGVGIVENGLAKKPTITNANGDLSINLLHAFDVHEGTGRIVFAYQDGPMFYRDVDGTFSEHFIWEGSAAMIQKLYPDEMVGENAYSGIVDKDERVHPIVQSNFGRGGCYLGGYFITYHHYPDRFARGLRSGKIALNRGENVSEISTIPDVTSDIGAVAICARDPKFIYAATTRPDDGDLKLHRSVDDGLTWTSLKTSTIKSFGTKESLNQKLHWNYIKSIAVDPDNWRIVYCGIGGTYTQNGSPKPGRFRVIKSEDGGYNFIDFSQGLPEVPVDEIITVESDNGLLFCATVYGIFYRTNDMDTWLPFNNQLPKVEITGLKYDYCNNVLYASTYGRGLWKTNVGFEVPNTHQDIISTDTVWDENRIQCDHVLVKAGVTLTINGIVQMYRNKEITVEEGGELILDGGKVLDYCDE